jgi:hypothetical protein
MRWRVARVTSFCMSGLLAFATLGSSPPAVASGDRLFVNVPEPFEVSGQVFPAGEVAVEHVGESSPATTVDQVRIGTDYVGVLIADRSRAADRGLLSSSLVFERSESGHLVLVGFTTGDAPAGRLYLYRRSRPGATGEQVVLIAGR